MDLGSALIQLFPDATPGEDYILRDDGGGAFIEVWSLSSPRPTEEDIKGALIEILKKAKSAELSSTCHERIVGGFLVQSTGHFYTLSEQDQLNFNDAYNFLTADTSLEGIPWETEDSGVIFHNRLDFFTAYWAACQHKLDTLNTFREGLEWVQRATTEEEINLINW